MKAADLAHELKRGRRDLLFGSKQLRTPENLDATAHGSSVPLWQSPEVEPLGL